MEQTTKGKVLIIEDEPGFRRIYKEVLEGDGYNVLLAEDGEQGLASAGRDSPDLILLDLKLPTMHGFEVLQKLKEDEATKDIPVIIFSVMGEQDDIQEGLNLGADDYAVKGFYSPREILSKIRSVLTRSDIRKSIVTYRLAVKEGREDMPKLERDIGLTKLLSCPNCKSELLLELLPDYTRTDGQWFSAHFICPKCSRTV